jgi:hypothetical protein
MAMDEPPRKPLTLMQRDAADEETKELLFQHTVLCQTCLPYRDPGDDVREWTRVNGAVHLKVLAGEAMHPESRRRHGS